MKQISFGWTTEPFLAGEKTVTRREWKDSHAAKFKAGDKITALDRDSRYGGKAIGIIQLIEDVRRDIPESIKLVAESDYYAEGFDWIYRNPKLAHKYWTDRLNVGMETKTNSMQRLWDGYVNDVIENHPDFIASYVVRFKVLELYRTLGAKL